MEYPTANDRFANLDNSNVVRKTSKNTPRASVPENFCSSTYKKSSILCVCCTGDSFMKDMSVIDDLFNLKRRAVPGPHKDTLSYCTPFSIQ